MMPALKERHRTATWHTVFIKLYDASRHDVAVTRRVQFVEAVVVHQAIEHCTVTHEGKRGGGGQMIKLPSFLPILSIASQLKHPSAKKVNQAIARREIHESPFPSPPPPSLLLLLSPGI